MKGGTNVFKYDSGGNLVDTYISIREARKAEHVRHATLITAIAFSRQINNHTFKLGPPYRKPTPSWERADGIFDIDAWARIAF